MEVAVTRLIPVLVLGFTMPACATFHGSNSQLASGHWRDVVSLTSSPSNAEVWVDGKRYGVTPIAIDLDKQRDHEVSFKRSGYHDTSVQLARSLNGKYLIFDVVNGLVPVVVDADARSWYAFDKNAVHATLQPASGGDDGVTLRGTLTEHEVNRLVAGESAAAVIGIPKTAR
jgi:PEGA domain